MRSGGRLEQSFCAADMLGISAWVNDGSLFRILAAHDVAVGLERADVQHLYYQASLPITSISTTSDRALANALASIVFQSPLSNGRTAKKTRPSEGEIPSPAPLAVIQPLQFASFSATLQEQESVYGKSSLSFTSLNLSSTSSKSPLWPGGRRAAI